MMIMLDKGNDDDDDDDEVSWGIDREFELLLSCAVLKSKISMLEVRSIDPCKHTHCSSPETDCQPLS
jgi:hypothetical protein